MAQTQPVEFDLAGVRMKRLLSGIENGFENFVAEAGRVRSAGSQPAPPSHKDVARLRDAAHRFGNTLLPCWGEICQSNKELPHE